MEPALLSRLETIAAAGIRILPVPQIPGHFVFERDECVVLVERRENGFGGIGSPGLLTVNGFEALIERNGRPVFVSKAGERSPEPGQADAARRLLQDLKQALL